MKITDGKVIAVVKVYEWDPSSTGFTPDWSEDYFTAGDLEFDDELDAYKVDCIQDYVDSAKAWAEGKTDADDDLAAYYTAEQIEEMIDSRCWDAIFYSPYYPNRKCETYEEAASIKYPKYFLDLEANNRATLYTVIGREKVWSGDMSAAGVVEDDPDYTNKLDDYFQKELGISPDEWGVG